MPMRIPAFLAAAWLICGVPLPLEAADPRTESLTPDQKRAVEEIVRDYLLTNPEILDEAFQALQAKREAAEQAARETALARLTDALENDPTTPIAGNAAGDVTVVEFFDYQCQYCRQALPAMLRLIEMDGMVRYAFKEMPILGDASVYAARAALAAWNLEPTKYLAFHSALMQTKGQAGPAEITALAAANGIDPGALGKAMADPRIAEALDRNFALAEELRITGTPAFVIGRHFVPGAVDLETLKELVAQARKE